MNTFEFNARKTERKFMREVKKAGYFRTVKGNINYLIEYGKNHLIIQTKSKGGKFEITRRKLRAAITYLYFKRSAIREDIQQFSSYSSALLGILYRCFQGISKIQTLKNGLYRISLLGRRFFASGLERDPAVIELLSKIGGKFVLFNYYHIGSSDKWLEYLQKYDLYAIIDSGGYSLYREKQKKSKHCCQLDLFSAKRLEEVTLEGYAAFINRHKYNSRILGFFPLDVIGDPENTNLNYHKLKQLTDAKIFPVWQFTDSLEALQKLVDEEHEMIGVGGMVPFLSSRKATVRKVLDKVFSLFSDVNLHFLGGANEILLEYGWFSSDSTAFLNARKSEKQRKIYLESGYRVDATKGMTTMEVIEQNLRFLIGLENRNLEHQLCFTKDNLVD